MERALERSGHHVAPDGPFALAAAMAPDLPPESYRLRFSPAGAGGTIALAAAENRGLLYACQTTAELMGAAPETEIAIDDCPAFPLRGLVEGFYGPPWSHDDRLSIIRFMGDWRLNTYIYAPKNDPYHRRLWRLPYTSRALARFAALATTAARCGVDFGVAISPGLTLHYADEDEYRLLLAKYGQFVRLGLRTFGLYLDDIPGDLVHEEDRKRFGSLALAQAALANRLYEDLSREVPGVSILLCPTQYHGNPDTTYLRELGRDLHPAIDVHWTGHGVWSTRIDRVAAEGVSTVLGRPPVYWDNCLANDYLMTNELHLSPYRGRTADLANAARGVLANPMNQALASRFGLATMALYLWRPDRYEPENAAVHAAREFIPAEATAAFAHFRQANAPRILPPLGPPSPRTQLLRAKRLIAREESDAGRRVWAAEVHRTETSARLLHKHLPTALRREIHPWLLDYETWATLAVLGFLVEEGLDRLLKAERVGARLLVYARLEGDLGRLRRGLRRSVGWRTSVCGGSVREHLIDLCQRVDGLIRAQAGFPPSFVRPFFKLAGLALPARRACAPPPP